MPENMPEDYHKSARETTGIPRDFQKRPMLNRVTELAQRLKALKGQAQGNERSFKLQLPTPLP